MNKEEKQSGRVYPVNSSSVTRPGEVFEPWNYGNDNLATANDSTTMYVMWT